MQTLPVQHMAFPILPTYLGSCKEGAAADCPIGVLTARHPGLVPPAPGAKEAKARNSSPSSNLDCVLFLKNGNRW